MTKPDCSLIIRAYNEENHIGRLLSGILEQTIRNVQIILVDSGSTDGTLEIASRYPVEIVHIQPHDFSFGRSLNLGISRSAADLVVMASAHVYPVYPDWLELLLKPFSDPKVALTYGKQRGGLTSKYSEYQIFRRWFPDHAVERQLHPFCNNANSAIRRQIWEQSPYDELLSGLEDLAWARWAQMQGYAISYVADAEVIHVHDETWRGIYNRYRRESMAFKQIYPQENFTFADFLRLWISNTWSDWRAAASDKCLRREWLNCLRFRYMQFWGTYQGYRRSGPLTWQLKQTFYYPGALPDTAVKHKRRSVKPILYDREK